MLVAAGARAGTAAGVQAGTATDVLVGVRAGTATDTLEGASGAAVASMLVAAMACVSNILGGYGLLKLAGDWLVEP